MADKEEKGQNIWQSLEGVKENLTDEIEVKMADTEVIIPIKFVDVGKTRKINEEYDEKKPDKPIVNIEVNGRELNIRVPSEDEKYQEFNNHPKAKEWEEKCEPIEEERRARLAYEFIEDEYKPSDDVEEGVEILQERLREMDILDIVQAGFELNGMSDRLEEAEKNS